MKTLSRLLGILILFNLNLCSVSGQTVQAGIFSSLNGNNIVSVKAKPSATLAGVFSGINVTVRWLTSYNVTVSVVSTSYSIAPQGSVGTSGQYSYQTFGAIPNVTINWAANSENELFTIRVDGASGLGTFELMSGPPSSADWYFELNGVDVTNTSTPFYQQSVGNISLPIQLSSFTGTVLSTNRVRLDWTTLSELNNYGFEVQRAPDTSLNFQSLPNSFVPGHGTTNVPQHYTFVDSFPLHGRSFYRLKQIDLDGTIHYTDGIQVHMPTDVREDPVPIAFALHQNYPNPFNPTTTIGFDLPSESNVKLEVFNLLGESIALLVNGKLQPGSFRVRFDAQQLASGIYLCRFQAGDFVQVRKILLLR